MAFSDTMKVMFLNEFTLQNFILVRHKIAYTVVYGIASFFKRQFLDSIRSSSVFVTCFEESLNKVSQRGQTCSYAV